VTRLLTGALLALALLTAAVPVAGAATLQPANLRIADGGDWHPVNDFRLAWDRLPGDAPARTSYLQIHDHLGNVVFPTAGFPWDGVIEHVQVPRPGFFSAFVWLEDFAGNLGPPVSIQLAFDDVRPGAVRLQGPGQWIGAKQAAAIQLEKLAK